MSVPAVWSASSWTTQVQNPKQNKVYAKKSLPFGGGEETAIWIKLLTRLSRRFTQAFSVETKGY